nr:putative ribonuclease H-like domain-containing protein [Tanacetum cinerariifolium]
MCNSVVLTWILNSISPELFVGQVFSKTASVVWADLQETYDKVDGTHSYVLAGNPPFALFFENPIHSERRDDEGRVASDSDGTKSLSSEEDHSDFGATLMEEDTPPGGISETNLILTNEANLSVQPAESVVPRRSSRHSNVPQNLNDFIIKGKVKYGVVRVVNYSNLSNDNFCFTSNLNKSIEPKTYQEEILDTN